MIEAITQRVLIAINKIRIIDEASKTDDEFLRSIVGTGYSTVSGWGKSGRNPTLEQVVALLTNERHTVRPAWLLFGSGEIFEKDAPDSDPVKIKISAGNNEIISRLVNNEEKLIDILDQIRKNLK